MKRPEGHPEKAINSEKPSSSIVPGTGIDLIPVDALAAIGSIYQEGLKHGRDSWKRGATSIEWIHDRAAHAERHKLFWLAPHLQHQFSAEHDSLDEDHLAKYIWWLTVLLAFRTDPQFDGTPGHHFAMYGNFTHYEQKGKK